MIGLGFLALGVVVALGVAVAIYLSAGGGNNSED